MQPIKDRNIVPTILAIYRSYKSFVHIETVAAILTVAHVLFLKELPEKEADTRNG